MNLPVNNTVLYSKHKNKCYCQNGNLCYCTGIENASRNSKQSPHKFIKVRSDKNHQNKSTSSCSTSSFSPVPTIVNSLSGSSMATTTGVSSAKSKLTGRREIYEKYKTESADTNFKLDVRTWKRPEAILFSGAEHSIFFSDDKIAKLQEFRLQNPDECLNSCNRFSVEKIKQLVISKEPIEETKYSLNSRGLLKVIGDNDDSRAAIVSSRSVAKDILRQKFNASKPKDKHTLILKAVCPPENSLALRYQKTY